MTAGVTLVKRMRCSSISILTLLAICKALDRREAARRMFRFLSIEHLFSVKTAALDYSTPGNND
jgi:hypothetical protein